MIPLLGYCTLTRMLQPSVQAAGSTDDQSNLQPCGVGVPFIAGDLERWPGRGLGCSSLHNAAGVHGRSACPGHSFPVDVVCCGYPRWQVFRTQVVWFDTASITDLLGQPCLYRWGQSCQPVW